METRIDEVGERIYRISTCITAAGSDAFTFNQFLVDAEQPLLFHTGMRALFPAVREGVARVIPIERLRWISFGHVEADECGSMNQWLAAAPHAQVVHGSLGCEVSIGDLADRPPHAMEDGQVLDLGGRRVRLVATPHVPHGWEAIVLFEEATSTLLCGDLFSAAGAAPVLSSADPVEPALHFERMTGATALTPRTGPTIRRLAELAPRRLALMHGSTFEGDGAAALRALADGYEALLEETIRAG